MKINEGTFKEMLNKPPVSYYPNINLNHKTNIEIEYMVFLITKKYKKVK